MSNLHKLFREISKLDYDDFDLLCDAWREQNNVKRNCKNMGIKYSDKYLINVIKTGNSFSALQPVKTSSPTGRDKKIEQIILGDNLDMIEEAAKKKGLI